MELAYFAAADDAAAAEVERRPGGPLGWAVVTGRERVGLLRRRDVVVELGPSHQGFAARGYDPMVTLGTLEELLTGRPWADVTEDPRWGAEVSDEEREGVVLTLTDGVQAALTGADDARLEAVAEPWGRTEELTQPGWEQVTTQDHLAFLRRLRDLAAAATARGERLYCFFEADP